VYAEVISSKENRRMMLSVRSDDHAVEICSNRIGEPKTSPVAPAFACAAKRKKEVEEDEENGAGTHRGSLSFEQVIN
jgi:hypothetical protein